MTGVATPRRQRRGCRRQRCRGRQSPKACSIPAEDAARACPVADAAAPTKSAPRNHRDARQSRPEQPRAQVCRGRRCRTREKPSGGGGGDELRGLRELEDGPQRQRGKRRLLDSPTIYRLNSSSWPLPAPTIQHSQGTKCVDLRNVMSSQISITKKNQTDSKENKNEQWSPS